MEERGRDMVEEWRVRWRSWSSRLKVGISSLFYKVVVDWDVGGFYRDGRGISGGCGGREDVF